MSGNRAGAAQVHQPLNTPEPLSASTVWGKNDAETATFYRSLEENSPWDHAQIKERPSWRSIAGSRALYDQMAPQLCLFYISAKFEFRPTRQKPKNDAETATFYLSHEENNPWDHAQIEERQI